MHMRQLRRFRLPVNAKNGTQNTVIPVALATGHCELRTDSVVSEVMVDDHGRAQGVKYFDAEGPLACADRRRGRRLGLGHGNGPAAAELPLEAVSPRGGKQQRLGWAEPPGPCLYAAPAASSTTMIYEGPGRGPASPSATSITAIRASAAAACWRTSSSPCPICITHVRPPGSPRWGLAHKDFQRQ